MKKPKLCTAIVDIGKTNKKFYLFDENYDIIREEMKIFPEIEDEDGFAADDLKKIVKWIRRKLKETAREKGIKICKLNFSTYGASLVHLGDDGKPVAPLYNYLKPFPAELEDKFQEKYESTEQISLQTASPWLGMLNAGLQLFFLKHHKPHIFSRTRWSLFLPQYLSYLFTDVIVSEYTSLGCHTMLWNCQRSDYHDWVYQEGLHHILAPLVPSWSSLTRKIEGSKVQVGVGMHDSSAALYPYVSSQTKPFSLLSTGTWSIAMNPFNRDSLTTQTLNSDCLLFMQPDGSTVMASRLFLGRQYEELERSILNHFQLNDFSQSDRAFDEKLYKKLEKEYSFKLHFEAIESLPDQPASTQLEELKDAKTALHQSIWELVHAQILKYQLVDKDRRIRRLFIDGGFTRNEIFTNMLARQLADHKVFVARSSLGSALGAAMVLSKEGLPKKIFKKSFQIKSV